MNIEYIVLLAATIFLVLVNALVIKKVEDLIQQNDNLRDMLNACEKHETDSQTSEEETQAPF